MNPQTPPNPPVPESEMRTYSEIKQSTDPLDRVALYINGLSPHNLWKAKAQIADLIRQNQLQLLEEMEKKKCYHRCLDGWFEYVPLEAIEELKKRYGGKP